MKNNFGEDIPDILYKYMPWRVDEKTGINYTKETLEKHRFYMCKPEMLNDPFDGNIKVDMIHCTDEEILKGLKQSHENRIKRCVTENEMEKLTQIVKGREGQEFRKSNQAFAEKILSETRNEIGVTCFSNNGLDHKENMLMWSHYTDSHKGICLKIKPSHTWRQYLRKVKYVDRYPVIDWIKIRNNDNISIEERSNKVINLYYYKNDVWHYENEYRIVQNINKDGEFFYFDARDLREVICGCNMKEEQVQEVEKTLKNYVSKVKLWKAEKEDFAFKFKPTFIGRYGKN